MPYIFLTIAIAAEVIGTNALKATEGFTKLGPSVLTVISYAVSFYFLALALKVIPVGVAYAIWSGLGIVLVAVVAAVVFKQIPDAPAIFGMSLIILGLIIIQVFSKMGSH